MIRLETTFRLVSPSHNDRPIRNWLCHWLFLTKSKGNHFQVARCFQFLTFFCWTRRFLKSSEIDRRRNDKFSFLLELLWVRICLLLRTIDWIRDRSILWLNRHSSDPIEYFYYSFDGVIRCRFVRLVKGKHASRHIIVSNRESSNAAEFNLLLWFPLSFRSD